MDYYWNYYYLNEVVFILDITSVQNFDDEGKDIGEKTLCEIIVLECASINANITA